MKTFSSFFIYSLRSFRRGRHAGLPYFACANLLFSLAKQSLSFVIMSIPEECVVIPDGEKKHSPLRIITSRWRGTHNDREPRIITSRWRGTHNDRTLTLESLNPRILESLNPYFPYDLRRTFTTTERTY
ncbi:MAG: hypothetical protein A2Y62_15960 [Candidatus Fischerbacteria bacterium RBG_13_37_8]|uniref:Uncharacterized protein n=1 Tax=Candidatus Fischerbacteria bacterium RBG_13_37_8 TaxID=1817863 RepID=A0A1F5VW44_9BACT|nr:MAG: hypothetical protein A2Y62_15960 [Candidatus Fischerbacteria bacterium RBG_13_37_8]